MHGNGRQVGGRRVVSALKAIANGVVPDLPAYYCSADRR